MVKAGLAKCLMNFTAKSASDEAVCEPRVGDCDEVDRYLRLPEIPPVKIRIFCIGGSSTSLNFQTFPRG